MDAAQRQSAAAVTGPLLATGRAQQTSGLLIPTVFSLVADQLTPNELALLLRPLCKEARDLLPDATAVQLSQPVTKAAFPTKWGQPSSMKHLNYCGCWLWAPEGRTRSARPAADWPPRSSKPQRGLGSCRCASC
jgi:hypothetical protein